MTLIAQYSNDYRNTLSGKYVAKAQKDSQQIGKGAAIKKFIGEGYQCSSDYKDEDIKYSIRSHQGDQISGFPSIECFRSLLIPQLAKLKDPIFTVLDEVYQQLLELAGELNNKVFSRFPDLMNLIGEVCNKKLQQYKQQTFQILSTLIQGEMNTVFTNNSKYLSQRDDLLAKTAQGESEDAEKLFIKEIRERLDGYFRIVVSILNDSIPKVIGFFLVRQSQQKLQMALFNELNRQSVFEGLGEPKQVQQQRKRLTVRIQTLQKSLRVLKRDPTVSRLLGDDD